MIICHHLIMTEKELGKKYPNDAACLDRIFIIRFGERNVGCPGCGKISRFHRIKSRKCYACQWCGHQLHPLTGTIFQKSSTPLTSWFYVIWRYSHQPSTRFSVKSISADFEVSLKCARRMIKKVKSLPHSVRDELIFN